MLVRQILRDPEDGVDKAEVEHAVGLVEDEKLHCGEIDGAAFGVIEEASRRRHDHVDAAFQTLDLRLYIDAAVDHRRAQRQAPPVKLQIFADLRRQLAGRHQDEGAGPTMLILGEFFAEHLHDRQSEGRRLAGAGLGAGEEVASGEDHRDRLGLDGGGGGIALAGNGAQQFGAQTERFKRHGT